MLGESLSTLDMFSLFWISFPLSYTNFVKQLPLNAKKNEFLLIFCC